MNPTTSLGRCWGSSSSCYPWVSACHSARHCEEERFSGSPRISKAWWEKAGANLANSHIYIYIQYIYICLSWRLKRLHPLIMKVGGKEKCQQQNTLVSHQLYIIHPHFLLWFPTPNVLQLHGRCFGDAFFLRLPGCVHLRGVRPPGPPALLGYLRIIKATVSCCRKTAWWRPGKQRCFYIIIKGGFWKRGWQTKTWVFKHCYI